MYSILLGLEGSASIGGRQKQYTLLDEKGHQFNQCTAQFWLHSNRCYLSTYWADL